MPEPKWNPVQEVRQKYPGLKDWPDSRILENLSDPTRFRTAFPQYAHLGDDVIKRNIGDLQKGMDFTANPKGEGLYKRVQDASKAGYRMIQQDMRKYARDTAADPNAGQGVNLPAGVRVAGRNAAGRPILEPEENAKPEGSAAGRLASSFGKVFSDAASGLYHIVADEPQTLEEIGIAAAYPTDPMQARVALAAYRAGVKPAIEQGKQAVSEFKQAQAATPWTENRPGKVSPVAYQHRQLALGHALGAAIPVLGPAAAQLGEQLGTQVGEGDIAGAVGTAAGNILLYEAPHLLGKIKGGIADAGRTPAEALTNTGPRQLKELAEKTVKANADAAKEAAEKNAKAAQEHLEKTQEALHKTRGSELEAEAANKEAKVKAAEQARNEARAHQKAVEEVRQHNDRVLKERKKREQAQQKLNKSSQDLQQKIETAKAKAKAADDAAWDTWREKVGAAEIPSDSIVDQIKASKNTISDPEDVAEFRKVLKEAKPSGAEASELQSTRDSIAKQNHFGKDYESSSPENKKAIDRIVAYIGLDPDAEGAEASKPVNAVRLHIWKTQLEYAVRNATRGNVRYAIGQVLDKVRDMETQLSENAGAGKELAEARALHGPYKETFVNSTAEPRTVAGNVQAKVAPEYTKEAGLTKQLEMLGNYDSSIPQLASHIDNLREGLAALPKDEPLREQIKPLPPAPEPAPKPKLKEPERAPIPERPEEITPERKTLGPAEIQASRAEQVRTSAEQLRQLGKRRAINSLFYTTPTAILSTLLGHPGYAITEVAMAPVILAGSHALANLLDKPGVVEWLGKVTPKDVAAFEQLPAAEKTVFTQNLRQMVDEAQKKKIAISPTLRAFVTSAVVSAGTPKTLKELREEVQRRQQEQMQPPTPTAVPEPTEPETDTY